MTRQIYPHHSAPSVFAVEERLHIVEERLHRVEVALAILTTALGTMAEETDRASQEDRDEDGSGTARRVQDLLAHVKQQVAAAYEPRPPHASA